VYSFACALGSSKGLEKMARLRDLTPSEANFSLICKDLSQVSQYVAPLPQPIFKLMKRALPGPFTFILNAGAQVTRLFRKSKKEIGIRIPDHAIPKAIIESLGCPLLVSSVHHDDEDIEYQTDPGLVHEKYASRVDAVVAGGLGHIQASTVINCTGTDVEVVRVGLGTLDGIV
jgi:tRNA threonylcarbamoyl adenosine modification protein (Sua5/YciO/YrdC/YwlC family)